MKNIIIVDMQKGFMTENNKHLIEKINYYIKSNRFDNIFFTKCINDDNSPYVNILNWHDMKDEVEQEIILDMPENSEIIVKNCYGISQKDIESIKQKGITEIEICGTDIDACCLAIAFNLFDNNIKPIILKDLCASSSSNKDIQNYAFKIIERQFGTGCIKSEFN